MEINRRTVLRSAAAVAATLAIPRIARSQVSDTLIYKPQADLLVVDPMMSTSYSTRYLAFLSYDTLYGADNSLTPHPQMVEGHEVENGDKVWRMKLRDGLVFHDGEPVLASDAVASINRWCERDVFGKALKEVIDELSAPSDKEIVFRLKRPFPLLPAALAKSSAYVPAIMPARLIKDPTATVTEVVGSGPYRFKQSEHVSGVQTVWEKFDGYVPRPGGVTEFTSGPKIPKLKRIEWRIIPDPSTATSALLSGEIDWYEDPLGDFLPMLGQAPDIVLANVNPYYAMGIRRFNHLHAPFNNAAIRRAVMSAASQADAMQSVVGTDPNLWEDGIGLFPKESPFASTAGMEALTSVRDYDKAKRELMDAGYKGEKVVYLQASNNAQMSQLSSVGADELMRIGMNVEIVALDFGSWLQRRSLKNPPSEGGWSITDSTFPGIDMWSPATHLPLRGADTGWPGWPNLPKIEELRDKWLAATDEESQKSIAQEIQVQALQDVPYIPTGRFKDFAAYRSNLKGVLTGMPLFYNVEKT